MRSSRRLFITASAVGAFGAITRSQSLAVASGVWQSTPRPDAPTGDIGARRQVESITWYYELRGRGPTVVLIPSGEGDCGSFQNVADALSREFTVLTFDMPGFSRSSEPPDFGDYSMDQAAREVAALVRALGLGPATLYGCSSGGQVALRMAADHSGLVRNLLVHEVAGLPPPGTPTPSPLTQAIADLSKLTDGEVVRACKDLFRNELNENPEAWDALGEPFHKRLERNYVTWVRRYVAGIRPARRLTPVDLQRRPVTWTIGGLTPAANFFGNVLTAQAARIQVGLLMSKHFPQVSIPKVLAAHIADVARA